MRDSLLFLSAWVCWVILPAQPSDIRTYAEWNLGQPLGQLRAVPVQLSPEEAPHLLLVYGEDSDVDPFMGMFFYPQEPLRLALYSNQGELVWKKTLHRGNIPGTWFNPVFPFDLADAADCCVAFRLALNAYRGQARP
jgi:hypothetical protein